MKEKMRRRREGGMTHVDIVEEWMLLKEELDSKCVLLSRSTMLELMGGRIPREEVREIDRCVMEHLEAFIPGCESTITGGWAISNANFSPSLHLILSSYRRGKPQSSDVDIVFCPPEEGQDIGLLRDLYRRLSTLGIVTHVLRMSPCIPDSSCPAPSADRASLIGEGS